MCCRCETKTTYTNKQAWVIHYEYHPTQCKLINIKSTMQQCKKDYHAFNSKCTHTLGVFCCALMNMPVTGSGKGVGKQHRVNVYMF